MAAPALAQPKEDSEFSNDKIIQLIKNMELVKTEINNPINDQRAPVDISYDILRLNKVISLLEKALKEKTLPDPSSEEGKLLYRILPGIDKDEKQKNIQEELNRYIQVHADLINLLNNKSDLLSTSITKDLAKKVLDVLKSVSERPDDPTSPYYSTNNAITSLKDVLQYGKKSTLDLGRAASAVATGNIAKPLPPRGLGPMWLVLSDKTSDAQTAYPGDAPQYLAGLFRDPKITDTVSRDAMAKQNAVTMLARATDAYQYYLKNKDTGNLTSEEGQNVAKALGESLSGIKSSSLSRNPAFQAVVASLKSGDLTALTKLEQLHDFDSLYKSLGEFYYIKVKNNALSVVSVHATVNLLFDKDAERKFEAYRTGNDKKFPLQFLYLTAGINYQMLQLAGVFERQAFSLDPSTGKPIGVGTTERQRVDGSGHVVQLPVSATFAAGFGGVPIEINVFTSIGYKEWSLNPVSVTDASGNQTPANIGLSDSGFAMGWTGVELVFPGKTASKRRLFRLERVGIAFTEPQIKYANLLGYVTMSANWKEGDTVEIRSLITPQIFTTFNEPNLRLDLNPVDLRARFGRGHQITGGPIVSVSSDFRNLVFEFGLNASYQLFRETSIGLPALKVDLAVGGRVETLGDPLSNISAPYVRLGLSGTIPDLTSGLGKRKVVPRRIDNSAPQFVPLSKDAETLYGNGLELLRDGTSSGYEEAAKKLAASLQQSFNGANVNADLRITSDTTYVRALELLNSGKLEEGISKLQEVKLLKLEKTYFLPVQVIPLYSRLSELWKQLAPVMTANVPQDKWTSEQATAGSELDKKAKELADQLKVLVNSNPALGSDPNIISAITELGKGGFGVEKGLRDLSASNLLKLPLGPK